MSPQTPSNFSLVETQEMFGFVLQGNIHFTRSRAQRLRAQRLALDRHWDNLTHGQRKELVWQLISDATQNTVALRDVVRFMTGQYVKHDGRQHDRTRPTDHSYRPSSRANRARGGSAASGGSRPATPVTQEQTSDEMPDAVDSPMAHLPPHPTPNAPSKRADALPSSGDDVGDSVLSQENVAVSIDIVKSLEHKIKFLEEANRAQSQTISAQEQSIFDHEWTIDTLEVQMKEKDRTIQELKERLREMRESMERTLQHDLERENGY